MDTKSTFARRLEKLRKEADLSQTQLAEALGVSRGSVSYYEKDERTAGIDFLIAAANYFNVPSDWLLGLTNTRESENVNIGERTGLSDEAIDVLHKSRASAIADGFYPYCDASSIANYLLTHPAFSKALWHVGEAQHSSWLALHVDELPRFIDLRDIEEEVRLSGHYISNPEEITQVNEFHATKLINQVMSELCAIPLYPDGFMEVIADYESRITEEALGNGPQE